MQFPYPTHRMTPAAADEWYWMATAFYLLSGVMCLTTIFYFRRAWQRRPSRLTDLITWVGMGAIEITLAIWLSSTSELPTRRLLAALYIPTLLFGLLGAIHCQWALWTNNQRVREQAILLGQAVSVIVVGSLSLLLLTPVTRNAREASRRSQCKNNLKQIGLALHNWHDLNNRFVDPVVEDPDAPPRSWRVALLPYIDATLSSKYERKQPWDSPTNIALSKVRIPVYECPSLPQADGHNTEGQYFSAYATVVGKDTAFPQGKGLPTTKFTDGTSNTILVVEACGQQIIWSKPQDIEFTRQSLGVNLPGDQPRQSAGLWSSHHTGGAHTLLADGSVRFISEELSPYVLRALLTPRGAENLGDF